MPIPCARCQHANEDGARFCLQCGNMLEQAPEAGGDPLVGRVIADRYRVVSLLGEGGMGRVYLAEQKMGTATRKVAIKTLHPELSRDAQLVQRFHRECETVISLSHPNTVQFYDFGELPDKTLYIVMEFIEGESLAHVLERGPLEPSRVDRILVQICGSLQEAHDHGIVHRDLKPENILLTRRGGQNDFVKVLDFGIAKRSEAEDEKSQKLTKQGMVLGTPPYMSPEQFAGKALDARSDIYSLGVVTYEMLTGKLPFEAATPWEWATKHLTSPPTPFEQHPVAATLPEHKKQAVLRALAKNPEQRFATVTEFMQAFTGIGDAESAWALVTHLGARQTGASQQPPTVPPGAPRGPAHTPSPMPQAPAWNTGPAPGYPSVHGAQGPPGTYPGVPPGPPSNASSLPKVLLLLGGMFVLMGGAAVAVFLAIGSEDPGPSEPVASTAAGASAKPPPAEAEAHASDTPSQPPTTGETVPLRPVPLDTPPPPTPEPTPPANEPPTEDAPPQRPPPDAMPAPARRALERAQQQLGGGHIESAVDGLRDALRHGVRRNHPQVLALRRRLTRLGANRVGNLLMGGQCAKAQRLYLRLRSVGAHKRAVGQFTSDWCPRP